MAERSQFWTTGTTGDGATAITEAQTTEWFRDLTTPRADANSPHISQGPLRGVLGELAVTGGSSPVSVAAGAAACAGYYYKNDSAVSVAIPTPAGATRIDRIVLRVSHGTTRTVRIVRLAGTEGSGAAPALVQTAGTTWDIPLARVSITTGGAITITDDRVLAQFATNHVKRDGDTMTGGLTAPTLTATGAVSGATAAISGAATVGSLNGGTPWTTANDGQGSGLDADLVAGVAIEPIQRRGGDASNWGTPGSNAYSPSAFRMQAGVVAVTISANVQGSANITFPAAFANTPLLLVSLQQNSDVYTTALVTSTSGATITVWRATSGSGTYNVGWLALGPV